MIAGRSRRNSDPVPGRGSCRAAIPSHRTDCCRSVRRREGGQGRLCVYVDQALLPKLVAQRSQPPLTPYRRRTAIWRQSGGALQLRRSSPKWPMAPQRRAARPAGNHVARTGLASGRCELGPTGKERPAARFRACMQNEPYLSASLAAVARRAAAGPPKARGRRWCRANGAAGAALSKYGSIRQRSAGIAQVRGGAQLVGVSDARELGPRRGRGGHVTRLVTR